MEQNHEHLYKSKRFVLSFNFENLHHIQPL